MSPKYVRGFLIAGTLMDDKDGRTSFLVSYDQAVQPEAFLRIWYGLGGDTIIDEDGTPMDPDNC